MEPSYRCACPEQLGDGTPSLKLPTNRPLVFVRDSLRDYSQDKIWNWVEDACARWTSVSDIRVERIMDPSDAGPNDVLLLITVADLGGGGVLADQQLPYVGGRVLRMRINSRINWKPTKGRMAAGTVDPLRVICHELGHAWGMVHFPVGAPAELMEPTVSNEIESPQPTEGRLAADWFGPPVEKPKPPTAPVPTPIPGAKFTVMLDIDPATKIVTQVGK
jgi:hypothetical protein